MFPLWLNMSCVLFVSVYTPKLLCKSTAKYKRQKIQSCQTTMMEVSAEYSTAKKTLSSMFDRVLDIHI